MSDPGLNEAQKNENNAQASEGEPSMEDILSSIRRIISDDNAEEGEAQMEATATTTEMETPPETPAATPTPVAEPEKEEDILDLGAPIEEEETPLEITPEPEPEPLSTAPSEPAEEPIPTSVMAEEDDAELLSDDTAAHTSNAFAQLRETVSQINSHMVLGQTTLEDLLKELLKPMLKDWLDTHLPQIVNSLVQEEIERLSRKTH